MAQENCIKCSQKYEEEDAEAYYCPSCLEEKKKLASVIDARIKSEPPKNKPLSGIQLYDSLPKVGGFVRAKDLL